MSEIINRGFKNSVFIDMFAQDVYRLQLFQTLHPEMTDITASDIQTITLKQVITNHQYNDLAFLVKDRLMVFVEAQSTWSVNILIRVLLYLADTIQEYLHGQNQDIHSEKQLNLPLPEFYIIYTGTRKVPSKLSLKQDFFRNANAAIDLEATVFTAETQDIIGQYILFCRVLDEQISKSGRTKDTALEAIRICQDRGVLAEYLREREKEVIDIMITLFDQEYAVEQFGKQQKAEGRAEGRAEGKAEGIDSEKISNLKTIMRKMQFSAQKAMDFLDIAPEDQEKYGLMLKEDSKPASL